jgi:aspartyl protease family protein
MQHPDSRQDSHPRAGRRLAWLAAVGLIIGLTALFQAVTERSGGIVRSSSEGGRAMIVLERDRSGHFLADGQINGREVLFLLDTGATDVAVSERKARELGLEFGPRIAVRTAAGPVAAWRTRLDRVSLGSLSLENVRATISPGLGEEALLGMSFLQYFNLRQEGDQLLIESGAAGSPSAVRQAGKGEEG